jgi:DNA-binding NtrC family response regulator
MTPRIKFDVVSVAEVPTEDADILPAKRRPVILVVDDERVIADTLSVILSRSGFTTMTAYDGASALELAKNVAPELLISDVVMPGMTGVDLAITITQTIPGCKVLLFSGQAATVDLLAKARHSGHDFTTLAKPVHPTDMLRRISECLAVREPGLHPVPSSRDNTPQTLAFLPN